MINKDNNQTMPFKLATGTKPSVSHLRVLFCLWVVWKSTAHVNKKALNMRHQAQILVSWYLCWNSTASKRVSCLRTEYKEDNIIILCYFWWNVSTLLAYMSWSYAEAMTMHLSVTYTPYDTPSKGKIGNIITFFTVWRG